MEWISNDLTEIMRRPAIVEALVDILICVVPIWVAVMIGLVIGWSWKPRWTGLLFLGLRSKFRFFWTAIPPGLGARRLWFAFTALSAFSVLRRLWSNFYISKSKSEGSLFVESSMMDDDSEGIHSDGSVGVKDAVTEKDLEHLFHVLEGKDGAVAWQSLMERTTPNMTYQAWRYEPVVGSTQYRSKTVFEDATPELVRDFFWDDEFRTKWDPMLIYYDLLEECPSTGTTIVHWIKKFPFFCSDREYIIGRRVWESGKSFYCVTKGVPHPLVPRRDKPRRVDLYFSSWCIRPVESRKGDGQLSACEVTLIHYEDMGIPKDVAKVGVRHGMWGAVKRLHSGVRAYQNARKLGASPSKYALSAQISTKVPSDCSSKPPESSPEPSVFNNENAPTLNLQRAENGNHWKWIVIGGTVAVVCGLHTGMLGKAILFGAARRLARK
ncbi:StAR-related lipid transfer protein 7 [Nymphaea thermarum]|nr:StAR-related lipid transfer protein 7 [Nymphaea thermarum]